VSRSSVPGNSKPSYAAVLALPHARGPFAAALLARLCYGLQGLPLLITVRNGTGSYAAAGAAAALFGLGAALLGPARARLVARRRPALLLLAGGYAATLVALAMASAFRLPAAVAIGLAATAGLCPPPIGPLMRALWSRLAPGQAYLQRALSLDTAAESAAFALGPALAGLLINVAGAPAVLVLCAALALAGCAVLARTPADGPARLPGQGGRQAHSTGAFGRKGMLAVLLFTWVVAFAVNAAQIAIVAAWGTVTAGALLALFPVGGVAGGLAYGRRDWRGPLARRPAMLAAASAACYTLPALAFLPAAAAMALLLAGACADILLITAYQLVDQGVAPQRQAEAGAWLNTAYNLGAATGAAAGGITVSAAGPQVSFLALAGLAGACALAGFGICRDSLP
jgi:predicted MFS family arabinose efflux permease